MSPVVAPDVPVVPVDPVVPVVNGTGHAVSLMHSCPRKSSVTNSAPLIVSLVQTPGVEPAHSMAFRRPMHCVVTTVLLTEHVAQHAPSPSAIGHTVLPDGGHSVPFIHVPL